MDGDDDHQINEFNKEWETLEGTVTYYLNAVFPGKDFSVRYKPTNNANDHTYWPFWITLYEDEDIIKVGLRALKIISKIYQEYFKNGGKNLISYKPDKDTKASSQIETVTAFTEDAYHALETKIPSAMLKKFIDTLTDSRILSKDKVFERAYVFVLYERQMDQQEIALLFREFYRQVKGMFEDDNRINTPWEALTKVFLDKDLMPFKADNLKNLCTNIVQQYRKNRFKKGKAGTSISSAIKCYEDVKEILSPIFK